MTMIDQRTWTAVCATRDIPVEWGVAVLIGDLQIALIRTFDGQLYALDNRDPFSGAFVLSRGIVGSRGAIPTLASPLHKQVFDLRTGRCLDDGSVTVATYEVREQGGRVEILVATRAG